MIKNETETGDNLTALLREARPSEELPPAFARSVWQRISAAEAARATTRPAGWVEQWVGLLLQPRWALAASALLLIAGIVAGTLDGSNRGREQARDRYVSSVNPAVSD